MKRTLVVFDFDYTMIDVNSDTFFVKYFSDELHSSMRKDYRNGIGWTQIMAERLLKISQSGKTEKDFIDCLGKCPLSTKDLLIELVKRKNEFHITIASDSNTYFIEKILSFHNFSLNDFEIITNPATYENNELRVSPLMNVNNCENGCNVNICKGRIMKEILGRNEKFQKVVYVGDGRNDFCGATVLSEADFVFYRKGYRLEKLVTSAKSGVLSCNNTLGWKTYKDLHNLFRKYVF